MNKASDDVKFEYILKINEKQNLINDVFHKRLVALENRMEDNEKTAAT